MSSIRHLDDYLSISETALRLGISTKTVHNYIDKGYLKAERFGPRCIRISIDAINDLYTPYGKSYKRVI
jgi:excisionase family DNA binding protein